MNFYKINDPGCISMREASESKREELFDQGWKPIDTAHPGIECGENETIRAVPFDAGEKISFTYEKVIDKKAIQRNINDLIKEVAATDYQVRKCQEYALVGKPIPYDIQAIHTEAEAIRIKIRELEKLL